LRRNEAVRSGEVSVRFRGGELGNLRHSAERVWNWSEFPPNNSEATPNNRIGELDPNSNSMPSFHATKHSMTENWMLINRMEAYPIK
jgi:hypothetical protein